MSLRAVCAALLPVLAQASCAAPSGQQCELQPPISVAHGLGLSFDGIAVAAVASRDGHQSALYLWSDASGLWVRRGTSQPALRLTDRCRGGVAAQAAADGRVFVACSRATEDDADEASEVAVYELDGALHARPYGSVGRAGRDGRGVALALLQGAVHVAFHDGSIGEHAVSLARLDARGSTLRRVSHAGSAASEPALLAHGGHVYVAFNELSLSPAGDAESSLWLARDQLPARRILRTRATSPTPTLTADARGLVLGYRDRVPGVPRSELFVQRLDRQGAPVGTPHSVGRANSDGEPTVHGCGALTTALLPREYGGERFVGVNALDGELRSMGAGHQLYATGRDYVLASGVCIDGAWQLLAADRASPAKPGVEAVALRFSCGE